MKRDKIFWFLATSGIIIFLVLAVFVPGALAQVRGSSTSEYLELFDSVFNFVNNNYVDEVDPKVLFEGALKGLFESLDDPHSVYLTGSDMQDLTDTTSGKFGGVGLYISSPPNWKLNRIITVNFPM
jgi:carboxyl-terminal processing protease